MPQLSGLLFRGSDHVWWVELGQSDPTRPDPTRPDPTRPDPGESNRTGWRWTDPSRDNWIPPESTRDILDITAWPDPTWSTEFWSTGRVNDPLKALIELICCIYLIIAFNKDDWWQLTKNGPAGVSRCITQLAKVSIDPKFVELTSDVVSICYELSTGVILVRGIYALTPRRVLVIIGSVCITGFLSLCYFDHSGLNQPRRRSFFHDFCVQGWATLR